MKAGVLFSNEDIRYTDYEDPKVGESDVKIKIRATGLCGSDIPRVLADGAHYYPIVLGHEFCGEVAEIGAKVTSVAVGDRVTAAPLIPCFSCDNCAVGNHALCKNYTFIGSRIQGSFAEFLSVPERNVVKLDKGIPFEEGALIEPITVALHGLLHNDYKGGFDVAVIGAGTIGIFMIQWAKIMGAKTITAFDVSKERLELAKEVGADYVINSTDEDYIEKAMALTNGKGYNYVFEMVGHPSTILTTFKVAANKANVCMVGTPHSDVVFTYKEWELMNRKEFKLTGSWMSFTAPFPGKEWELTAHYLKTGEFKVHKDMVFKKYPMSEISDAFSLYKNPRDVKGKVMLIND